MGATSICPGPTEYDSVLMEHHQPVVQNDQHMRTETFTLRLLKILAGHGVHDIQRLLLGKGPGNRDMLSLTLNMSSNTMLSYRVTFPIGADPFADPGWVAAELIRQSAAARRSLHPSVG
jgi:hypothetical protein